MVGSPTPKRRDAVGALATVAVMAAVVGLGRWLLGGGLVYAAENGDPAMIQRLCSWGANPRYREGSRTPLMFAVEHGNVQAVEALLHEGADPNDRYLDSRETVLMRAAGEGFTAVVKALLKAGADVNARDDEGWTALRMAQAGGDLKTIDLLKAAGARR